MSAKQTKWVTLGRVSGVYGVKGWLKVQSYTQPADNVARLDSWTLRIDGAEQRFHVEDGHSHAGSVVAKLRGIDDRDRARDLVGAEIAVAREQLPPTQDDELYWTDLEGLEVRTTTGIALGKVDRLLATGSNDVLVLDSSPERLIPFVTGTVVKEVDLDAGVIVVDWSPEY